MAKSAHPSAIDSLPPFTDDGNLNAVVETPAGFRSKLKYEAKAGLFVLGKVLPEGFSFPFDFGFIPGTLAEDGDPLDVMLICESGTAPGCLVPARLLGVLEIRERKKKTGEPVRNDRILAVPIGSRQYAELESLARIPKALREQIEYFLVSYGALEGKKTRIIGQRGPDEARELVKQAAGRK
ncbi:MAG TPA: inorganic diphosphatase [Rhodocyclaceae bacterium]|nr:inorganic diphosphatase [Rhodocyclaceae bacterium]